MSTHEEDMFEGRKERICSLLASIYYYIAKTYRVLRSDDSAGLECTYGKRRLV